MGAQRNISTAYAGGAPGGFFSGVVWLIAGIVQQGRDAETVFAVLFFGGMLIVPVSLLIVRVLFDASKASAHNPFQRLGVDGTIVIFAGILIAYVLLSVAPGLAFAALALAISARYFAYRTIFDEPVYWALGASLAIIGSFEMLHPVPLPISFLLIVGITECALSALLLLRWKRRNWPPDIGLMPL